MWHALLIPIVLLQVESRLCVLQPSARPKPPARVTLDALLAEMTDLAGMAEFPDPPYTCRQFSSYDRASKSPSQDWFANADAGQFIRVEKTDGRDEFVMMEAEGPGAIVRIWSANPTGTIRIYLDRQNVPVIEAPMADLLGGKYPGIPEPIACERSRGWTSYFPIPYAKHCKVTSDKGGFYYHVNYRTYAGGTDVATLTPGEHKRCAGTIENAARSLRDLDKAAEPRGTVTDELSGSLAPGEETAVQITGPAAIRSVAVRIDGSPETLRRVVLRMWFDGESTVECPLGDFFGCPAGITPFASLPISVRESGMLRSSWVMPFERSASITLRNQGEKSLRVEGRVVHAPYEWTGRSLYFHADWHASRDVPTRPMQDWSYLHAHGKGVFAGAAFAIANPVKQWWGEGDEKIYVDGEEFPSHFGTGTEDYYGYAWCCPEPFQHAYHNQPRCDGPGNHGHTAVNRWHILDRIPFETEFRFDMELWHWHAACNVDMSVVAFWYARPGATSDRKPVQQADLQIRALPKYSPPRIAGAIEGEEMRIVDHTGVAGPQGIDPCSNESHLWWREGQKPGDKLVLEFDAPSEGRFRVSARFVKAIDYGVIQLAVNAEKAGAPLDFWNDGVIVSEETDLGEFTLSKGANRLTAEVIGANPKAVKGYMFGLDYLRLQGVRAR